MHTRTMRILSMMLALVMVIGMLPVSAFAAGEAEAVDAMIIFSDLHTSKSDYKESTVKGIMTAFKNTGLPFSYVVSAGDAFSVNGDNDWSNGKYTGDPTIITGYIQSAMGSAIPVHYVWSDHDRYGTGIDKNSGFVYGAGNDGVYGTADDGNYYVYSLSMADLSTNDRYSAGFHSDTEITATIAAFVEKAKTLDQSKPLFIASHQPLFDRRDDNGHALEWCTAINQVAETMDVAFFFGHNHKYDQSGDYYYAKGSTMAVTKPDYSSQNVKLNFTHLCAGYLAPSSTGSTSSTTRQGVAVAVVVYEDSVRYTTYNSSGIYTGSYAVDETVTRDHAVTEPELVVSGTASYFTGDELDVTVSYKVGSKVQDVTAEASVSGYNMNTVGKQTLQISYGGLAATFEIQVWEKTFTDSATGIAVEVQTPGATKLTVSDAANDAYEAVSGMLSSTAGYAVQLAGHAEGTAAIVTMPVPAGVKTPAVCRVNGDGTVTRMEVILSADGSTVSFVTDQFGTFLIGKEEITEDLENSVIGGGTTYEEKTVYVRVDAFENGGKYLVIGEDKATNGNPIAYLNNSGSEGWQIVTINSGAITAGGTTYSNGYIEIDNANAIWTASGSASGGYTLTNNGRYIGGTDANTLKSSSSEAVKVTYDASAVRLKTASGTTRYLYYSTYNSENWKWSTSANSSTSSRQMWIYKEVTVSVATSAPVTYTLQAYDVQHVLSTDTAQLQFTLLADGKETALPAGAAYSFEVKNDDSGVIAGISDTGLITFSNVAGSCFVKISCTWSEGTVYKYVKVTAEADPNACDHSYTSVTVEPTCTEAGSVTYTCACGDSYVEIIPATGHDYETVVTAPTCTEGGYTTYTCHCGHSYTANETAALGHSYTSVTVEPTCTEAGSVTYTCACGDSYAQIIPATGHDYETVVTAPTCTESGYTTYTCHCGHSYTANETAALGHRYTSVTVEPTCTEAGSVTYTCACGDSYAQIIPATGHDYETVVTAPTCTEGGYTTYTCHCGHSYTANETAALGHSYTSVTVEPTCTAGGYTTYTCACGDSYVGDETAALGHDYVVVTVEPTCTEGGYTSCTCRTCGEGHVYDETAALGHSYTSVTVDATCTEDGCTTHTCETCGHSYVSDVVNALGHDYVSVSVEATCTEAGSITHTCETCGDSYKEVIPALGHDYAVVTVEPTCTEGGFTTYTCDCGHCYVADETAALGHHYSSVTVNATCTEDGSVTYTCDTCGDSYAEILPAKGHDYRASVTAPTCTESGYTTYTCDCGHSYVGDETVALGHNYQSVVTNPTCTESGYTTYTCDCGHSYVGDETAALGHDYQSVVTNPTCTEGGYTTYTCAACDHSYVADETAALGHNHQAVVTAPTATTGGYTTYICACGDSYVADYTEALEGSLTAGGTAYEEKTVYVRVDSFVSGGKYLIIGEDKVSNGNPIAYLNNSGKEGWQVVTINSDSVKVGNQTYTNGYIETDNANAVWTASGDASNGYTLTNNGYYIGGTNANTLQKSSSSAVKVTYDASAVRLKTASGTTRYLYYSTYGSENWKWATSANSSSSSRKMWIYQQMTVATATSAPVTYTMQASDVQHVLSTNTAQLQFALLADGVAADLPAGGSYSLEVKYDNSGIISAISEDGLITFSNVAGTCHVKISYTWSEGTVYKYVKVTAEADPNACDHSYNQVTVDPTCTEDGSITYTCECGDTYTEVIPALGHDYLAEVIVPTCTEDGYTTYTCATCGHSYEAEKTAALGHAYHTVTEEATCTEDGSITNTCTVCGSSNTEVVPATGHNYAVAETAPDCENDGSKVFTCVDCGHSYEEVLPAKGHSYEAVVKAPTCETAGYTSYTCAVCGHSYIADETAALGHTYSGKVTAPTCTEGGYTTYTCADCGSGYTANETAALGHNYSAAVTAPTCEAGGYTTYTCANCGHSYTANETAALGHDYSAVVIAPTCEAGGYTTYTCANCGHSYTDNETAALGHDYTCRESNGYLVYTCANCGHSYSEKVASDYVQSSAFASNQNHVITVYSGGAYYALSHKNNKISVVQVTVSNGTITSEITDDLLWNYNNSKISYTNGDTTYYLYSSAANSWWGSWFGGSLELSTGNSSTVSYSNNKLTVGSLYLRYSGGSVSLNRSSTTTYVFVEQ